MDGALVAHYKDGVVTLDDSSSDWWMPYDNFDYAAFMRLISTNMGELDSERRAEMLTELQDSITTLQIEGLGGKNEELLELALRKEREWKHAVVAALEEDEDKASRMMEEGKESLTFEPQMDVSEFSDWFDKASDEERVNMLSVLRKALDTEGIPALEKERIDAMIKEYDSK